MSERTLEQNLEFLHATLPEVEHSTNVSFLTHLSGTREILESWGARGALCDAGLFHSVYGTQYFEPRRTLEREEVQRQIGREAEALAWLWCFADRHTLAANLDRTSQLWVKHRDHEKQLVIDAQQLRDLANLWAADAVEQMDRIDEPAPLFSQGLAGLRSLFSAQAAEAVRGIEARLAPPDAMEDPA